MTNTYLMREDAPFDSKIWDVLDAAMLKIAKSNLVGRRLLPIEGPYGIGVKGIPLADEETEDGLIVSSMLPLALIRKPFSLFVRDVASYESQGAGLNTKALEQAVLECVAAEEKLVFHGAPGIPGLLTAPSTQQLKLLAWDEVGTAAGAIIQAITMLDKAGFHGPFSLALAPERYNLLFRRYQQGNQSEMDHIRSIVTAGVFKAPCLESGGVLLASGVDAASIILGQDMSLGFDGPDAHTLAFFVSESLAVRIRYPQAICVLQ